jgi:ribosome recycling factor
MTNEVQKAAQGGMEKALGAMADQLKKIRTGRAQISMLDAVKVNYYGTLTPLNQVSAISTPDAKSFLISPWEAAILKEIEAGIIKSDLGLSPINDGKVIRLKVPDLTEERRKDLAKQCKKIAEDAKVAVRMSRRDANEALKKALKDKAISEDDNKRSEAEIQKITDQFVEKVDKLLTDKEKEILTV